MTDKTPSEDILAFLPISRSRALNRAVLRLIPSALMLLISLNVYSGLNFTPNAVSNRITDYSLLAIVTPLAIASVLIGLNGVRWLITACWFGSLGVVASRGGMTFRVGAMRSPHYPIEDLTIRYLFEMKMDDLDEDLIFEALQPPAKQLAEMLPRLTVTGEREPLNNRLLQLCPGSEQQLANILRPFVDHHRPNIDLGDEDDA